MSGKATATVLAVGELNFEGNIIPHSWYANLKRPIPQTDKPHRAPKPYAIAIILLSEIVYWYRPTIVRDEATGRIVEYRKKFAKDLLQRTYESFSMQFGFTKRQVKAALKYLEAEKVVELKFRSFTTKMGMHLNNVLYIDLKPERLKEITYKKRNTYDDIPSEVSPYSVTPIAVNGETCTETTTEITSDIPDTARAEKSPSAEQPPTAMKSLDSSEQATSTPTPTATDELEGAEALDAFGLDKYTPDRAPTASNGDWTTRQREAQEKEPWLGWSDGKLHPSSGIGMDKLECVGWLIERETGRVPVDGQWKGWGKACAAIYQAGEGDFPAILEGIRRGWAREEKYRPRHPNGYVNEVANVKAGKKTAKVERYSEAWYKKQMRDNPQRELNEAAYERMTQ